MCESIIICHSTYHRPKESSVQGRSWSQSLPLACLPLQEQQREAWKPFTVAFDAAFCRHGATMAALRLSRAITMPGIYHGRQRAIDAPAETAKHEYMHFHEPSWVAARRCCWSHKHTCYC
jgi:hypothetical protein